MIISHRNQFIFLKTNKTAGTSIEIALSRYCGPEDVITPISPEDELLREEHGGRGPQNIYPSLSRYSAKDWKRLLLRGSRLKYYNHIPGAEVRRLIGPEVWDRYFKFCIERNPWDRLISLYSWRYPKEPRPSLKEFLESPTPLALQEKGRQVYMIEGKVAVDKVCLYERLQADLDDVAKKIGLPGNLVLPRAKGGFRKDKRPYQEIFGPEERQKVEQLFAQEISLFDFKFA